MLSGFSWSEKDRAGHVGLRLRWNLDVQYDSSVLYQLSASQRAIILGAALFLLVSPCLMAQGVERRSDAPTMPGATVARAKGRVIRVLQSANDLAEFALGTIGVKYRYGGTDPSRGFDCSGLVQFVFQQVAGVTLPRTARELSRVGSTVEVSELMPGDLVFFNTRRFAFSHVGIYLGDSSFIHAPRTGRHVAIARIDGKYWQTRFAGARRLVGAVPGLAHNFVSEAIVAAPSATFALSPPAILEAGFEF